MKKDCLRERPVSLRCTSGDLFRCASKLHKVLLCAALFRLSLKIVEGFGLIKDIQKTRESTEKIKNA